MPIPYPCIDAGFIYDPGKKLDRLMSDFYEAEYSQSYLFYGSITSLPWILQTYQDEPTVAANKIRSSLMSYFEQYYDFVEVETAVMDTTSAVSYDMRLYVHVTQGTESVKLSTQLKVTGTKFEVSIKNRE